jgi:phage gp36-like protein
VIYATVADLIAAFSQDEILELSNIDYPDATTINNAVVERAIEDAQAQIDTYLETRYRTPLAVVPIVIRNYTCDLARYILDKNRPREEVTRRRDLVFYYLKDVAANRASLPGIQDGTNGATVAGTTDGDVVIFFSPGRTWTADTLGDF